MKDVIFCRDTQILIEGSEIKGRRINTPEVVPIYLTTAFSAEDLDDVEDLYSSKGYTYIRTRNPNRDVLSKLITYLEKGQDSIVCSSGMAAISTMLLSMLEKGDHILADKTLYGESFELLEILQRYGIDSTVTDFTNLDLIKKSIRGNTKVLYTETISNPTISIVDIEAIAQIAHSHSAKLIVDNTFATSLMISPIELGADVTINSLTKFANGHGDAVGGSATGSAEIIERANNLQVIFGCTIDPFTAYMCQRGIRTMDLRVQKQMDNASKLAEALSNNPYVIKVNHPSLESHPQHELAKRIFQNGYGAMLSFEMPDNRKKINEFMQRLNIAHYAMTLGGYRTTLSYPVLSSHNAVPEAERLKMGISNGLMRVSVGIENPKDLIDDFNQALEAFK